MGHGGPSGNSKLRGERCLECKENFGRRIENETRHSCGEGKTLEDGMQGLGQTRVREDGWVVSGMAEETRERAPNNSRRKKGEV